MDLVARLTALTQGVATDIKALQTADGNLASLTTTAKSNLVAALNELKGLVDGLAASAGAQIDDAATLSNKTWSSSKISTQISDAVAALVNSAPGALDTLGELAAQLTADGSAISAIITSLGNRLRFDAVQTLTAGEKTQGATNLGIGEPDTDFLAIYTAAKA